MNTSPDNPNVPGPSITYDLKRWDLFVGISTTPFRNRVLQVYIAGLLTICVAILVLSNLERSARELAVLAVFYVGVVMLVVFVSTLILSFAMAFFPRQRGVVGAHTLTITERGLVEDTQFNESMTKWPAICRIVKQRGYLYVYVSDGVYHQVPRRRISAQELAAFETELFARATDRGQVEDEKWVFLAEIDLQSYEVLVAQRDQIGMCGKVIVQDVTPAAPFTADFEQNPAIGKFGFGDRVANVLIRITLWVVLRYRNVFLLAVTRGHKEN